MYLSAYLKGADNRENGGSKSSIISKKYTDTYLSGKFQKIFRDNPILK